MRKQLLLISTLFCSSLMAQKQLETFTASDVNHNNAVDVEDVTHVVSKTLGEVSEGTVVDAAALNEVLLGIYQKLDQIQTEQAAMKEKIDRLVLADENGIISNGFEYVDLGMKDKDGNTVYWATCNIGALTPYDNGYYFAWGDINGYSKIVSHVFDWSTYCWIKEGGSKWIDIAKYTMEDDVTTAYWYEGDEFIGDGITQLLPEDDAAQVIMGGDWRMPTDEEYDWLINKCRWTWTVKGEERYYTVIGSNGELIILPSAGYRTNNGLANENITGHYWTSTIGSSTDFAQKLYFDGTGKRVIDQNRNGGLPIRAVCVAK